MNEKDILKLIENDRWMMGILRVAEKQNLKDWVIGAGFVRNKVWDHLHRYKKERANTSDIDLVYFDPHGNDEEADRLLSRKLNTENGLEWEVVNEFYAHKWNNIPPYTSTEDALSQWPETATGVGVNLYNGKLMLMAPHGIDDLVNMVIRPSPKLPGASALLRARVEKKGWFAKWPKLKLWDDKKK